MSENANSDADSADFPDEFRDDHDDPGDREEHVETTDSVRETFAETDIRDANPTFEAGGPGRERGVTAIVWRCRSDPTRSPEAAQ